MEEQGPVWLSLLEQFKSGQHTWNGRHMTGKVSDPWETANRWVRAWEPPAYGMAWEGGSVVKRGIPSSAEALPEAGDGAGSWGLPRQLEFTIWEDTTTPEKTPESPRAARLGLEQKSNHHMQGNEPSMPGERTTRMEERKPSPQQREEGCRALPISQGEKFHNSPGTRKRTQLLCISSVKQLGPDYTRIWF